MPDARRVLQKTENRGLNSNPTPKAEKGNCQTAQEQKRRGEREITRTLHDTREKLRRAAIPSAQRVPTNTSPTTRCPHENDLTPSMCSQKIIVDKMRKRSNAKNQRNHQPLVTPFPRTLGTSTMSSVQSGSPGRDDCHSCIRVWTCVMVWIWTSVGVGGRDEAGAGAR
jgi:hypothetical protein